MANKKLDPAKVAAVVAAIRAGHPRNEVVRQTGVSAGTVTKIAQDHGLSFDRTATMEATAAKKADAAALRAQLELDYLADAQKLRQRVWESREYREVGQFQNFEEGKPSGSKYSDWLVRVESEPLPADQLKLMQASTIAAGASQKIADAVADKGVEEVASMLGDLFVKLGDTFRTMQATDQPGEAP